MFLNKVVAHYACLQKKCYRHNRCSLVPLRYKDIFLIQQWRNEQLDILRQQKLLTNKDQIVYYFQHIAPTFSQKKPSQILFSFLQGKECIGYGGLTNINWRDSRAELSFLLKTVLTRNNNVYEQFFSTFLTLIKAVSFNDICLNRIFTETYDMRPTHIKTLEKNDFFLEGRLKQHVIIQTRPTDSLIHGCIREKTWTH